MSRRAALAAIGGSVAISPTTSSLARSIPEVSDNHGRWRVELRHAEKAACDAIEHSDAIRFSLPANLRDYLFAIEHSASNAAEDPVLEAQIVKTGYYEALEVTNQLEGKADEIRRKLFGTRAKTIQGVAVQARELADELVILDKEYPEDSAIKNIAAALEDLIKGGSGTSVDTAA